MCKDEELSSVCLAVIVSYFSYYKKNLKYQRNVQRGLMELEDI